MIRTSPVLNQYVGLKSLFLEKVCFVSPSKHERRLKVTIRKSVDRLDRVVCVVMILPQVHLRKPCYDFTFL